MQALSVCYIRPVEATPPPGRDWYFERQELHFCQERSSWVFIDWALPAPVQLG
jgi:hypothetical protein